MAMLNNQMVYFPCFFKNHLVPFYSTKSIYDLSNLSTGILPVPIMISHGESCSILFHSTLIFFMWIYYGDMLFPWGIPIINYFSWVFPYPNGKYIECIVRIYIITNHNWLVVWNMNFIFPFSWEIIKIIPFDESSIIFQRARSTTLRSNH